MKTIGMILSFLILVSMVVMYVKHNHAAETDRLNLQIEIERAVGIAIFKGTDV